MPRPRRDKHYTFDLECTSKEPAICYIAAVNNLYNENIDKVILRYSIKSLVDYIFSRPSGSTFYAHNLKYDISFIWSYLFQNHPDDFYISNSIILVETKSCITCSIIFRDVEIKFVDTYPLFTAPLKAVLEAYTDVEKGETPLFDYIEDVEITTYIEKYVKIDALGLSLALLKRLTHGKDALTTASGAMKEYKEVLKLHNTSFNKIFPQLNPKLDGLIRKAYRGGFTYLNPRHSHTLLKDIYKYDVNSMYPAQMYNKPLPYGTPKIIENGEVITDEFFNLGIQRFSIKSCVVKDDYCPFLSKSNGFMGRAIYEEYIDETEDLEDRTFCLTLNEFELFKKSYKYEGLELLGGFLFKSQKNLFNEYIDKFWAMKTSSNDTIKAIGKLFLNALYGKFGESFEKTKLEVEYEDKIKYRITDTEIRPCGYIPVAIFITAYSRIFLLETIHDIGVENFVYCDTDSIHTLKRDDKLFNTHNSDIGRWKYEGMFLEAYYIRAKRYAGILRICGNYGKLQVTCAGIKKNDTEEQVKSLNDFKEGKEIHTIEFKMGVNGMYTRPKVIKI